MKVRKGNNNTTHPSLVVGLPSELKKDMGIDIGDEVMWVRKELGVWELHKLIPFADREQKKQPKK